MDFVSFLRKEAFDNLIVPAGYILDVQGWVNAGFDECLGIVCEHLKSKGDAGSGIVVEVGSWKGLSANKMANVFKAQGVKIGGIVCVDTWLGAPECWTREGREHPDFNLKRIHGYPSLFYTFVLNTKTLGNHDVITPFPIASVQGADVLRHYGLRAAAIYIDAAHEFKPVLSDLDAYFDVLEEDGIMWGDDYNPTWPGVCEAVNAFAAHHGLELTVVASNWILKHKKSTNISRKVKANGKQMPT